MYLILTNPSVLAGSAPQKALELGEPILHIDSVGELSAIESARSTMGSSLLILAVTVFTVDTLVVILPKRLGH